MRRNCTKVEKYGSEIKPPLHLMWAISNFSTQKQPHLHLNIKIKIIMIVRASELYKRTVDFQAEVRGQNKGQ